MLPNLSIEHRPLVDKDVTIEQRYCKECFLWKLDLLQMSWLNVQSLRFFLLYEGKVPNPPVVLLAVLLTK